jgi:hypothetical protein
MEGEGRVAMQIGGRGWYASVSLSLVPADEKEIALSPSAMDDWQRSEGWLEAATAGAALGLEVAGVHGQCLVTRVHGMPCDTSPGVVAVAAVRAAWAAIGFVPGTSLATAVERCITRGHQISVEALWVGLTAVTISAE